MNCTAIEKTYLKKIYIYLGTPDLKMYTVHNFLTTIYLVLNMVRVEINLRNLHFLKNTYK